MRAPAARPVWPQAVLFDLDGTLIHSAPDLHASVNILLARHGLGPLTLEQVISMIGNGVKKLVERAFAACGRPLGEMDLENEHQAMLGIYGDHLTLLTVLMPGAREAVETLHAAGIRLGVVTNKPQMPTEAILDHFGLSRFLGAVIGGDAGVARKPAPDMILAALDRLGATPEAALMVGDSPADLGAARAAGVVMVAVRGGYTNVPADGLGADRVIETLAELDAVLKPLAPVA